MTYLKDEQYYIDLYDLETIKECLRLWEFFSKKVEETKLKRKNISKEKLYQACLYIGSIRVSVEIAQRYKLKAETIKRWMEHDRKMQEKLDSAFPPDEIYCQVCFSRTKITSKDIYDFDKPVLFILECVKCKNKQAIYEDGTPWKYEAPKCPNCNAKLTSKTKNTKNLLITRYSCSKCLYQEKETTDFALRKKILKKEEDMNRKLLHRFRKEYCLNEKEGQEALRDIEQMKIGIRYFKEKDKKEKDPLYQKLQQLKILKIGQLKELIEKTIEKEGFNDLAFAKPDMGKHIVIEFSVNDMSEERQSQESEYTLKKLVKSALENANWKLMSNWIHYRLGILTGSLKAYQREEDLINLV